MLIKNNLTVYYENNFKCYGREIEELKTRKFYIWELKSM